MQIPDGPRGGGLAPSSWSGSLSYQSGAYYGSYVYSQNRTQGGAPLAFMFDYNLNTFASNGRVTFLFDISSFSGADGIQWSGFIFDTATQPGLGNAFATGIADPTISGSGDTYTLEGLAGVSGFEPARGDDGFTINVYNGEIAEQGNGAHNAAAIFSDSNPLIGSFDTTADGTYHPFSIDVSAAVIDDIANNPVIVPTLQEWALILFAILITSTGLLIKRRQS